MSRKQITGWIPVVLCMLLIFGFSSQNGAQSGEVSSGIVAIFDPIVAPLYRNLSPEKQTEFLTFFHFLIRKTAHFSIYFLLSLFAFRAFGRYPLRPAWRNVSTLALCFLYACTDEFHQGFVEGRGPSFRDVLIDTSGALLALVVIWAVTAIVKRRKKNT